LGIWIFALILSILTTIFQTEYLQSLPYKSICSSIIIETTIFVLFWITLFINTSTLCYMVYLNIKYSKGDSQISLKFYFTVFISFGYFRVIYYVIIILQLYDNESFYSGYKLAISCLGTFFSTISGGVISVLFSYNKGFYDHFIKRCKKCYNGKVGTEKENISEEKLTS